MKCLILCGGIGVIDPVSGNRIPKCMLKVGNRPLIWHVMKMYSNYGYKDFVLALGFGGDMIKEYFINSFELMHDIEVSLTHNEVKPLNKIPEDNWTIKLVDTGTSARTGARIARCERFLKFEPFFISYSDILADVNISELVASHRQHNKILTVSGVNPPSRFGTFSFDEDGKLSYDINARLRMKDSLINGGFMLASETIFEKLNPLSECNLELEIFDGLISENQINVFPHDGFWQNVDNERDLNFVQQLYTENKRPWLGID